MYHDSPWALGSLALLGLRSSRGGPAEAQARLRPGCTLAPLAVPWTPVPTFMVEEGGTPGASASWPTSPTVTGHHTHGLVASSPGPSLERSVDHQLKWVLHPPGGQRVWTCPTMGPRPGAVTHGQAMTSTMLQLDGLGSHPRGEHVGSNTREELAQEKAAVGSKGLPGGNSRARGG